MSKYTTEVRFICENYAGLNQSEGQSSINSIIANSRDKVFDFDFPIYDESYRSVLETKILKHYYTREIGCETVGLWKHFLDMKMNEIMPYYNQLYKSATLDFNPLYDCDYSTTSNRDIGHNEKTSKDVNDRYSHSDTRTDNLSENRTDNLAHHDTTSSSGSSKDKYSDTPQGALDNVENDTYLTNARIIDSSNKETNDGTNTGTQKIDNTGTQKNDGSSNRDETENGSRNFNSTDEYIEHVAGKRNSITYSKMLMEYRDTFLNIDMMIINELSGLFMNLW